MKKTLLLTLITSLFSLTLSAGPLHDAASKGYLGLLQDLINKGAKVNAKDNNGMNILHRAACSGNLPTVKYIINFLKKKAFIEAKDNKGCSPLHYAAAGTNPAVVTYLIQTMKKIAPSKIVDYVNEKEKTSHMTPLHLTAATGNLKIAKYLVSQGGNVFLKNIWNQVPLNTAIECNHLPMVKYFMQVVQAIPKEKNKPNLVLHYINTKSKDSKNPNSKPLRTPLHDACRFGYLNIVKLLIETMKKIALKKQVVNYINTKGWNKYTALHHAALKSYFKMCTYLIHHGANKGAKINLPVSVNGVQTTMSLSALEIMKINGFAALSQYSN